MIIISFFRNIIPLILITFFLYSCKTSKIVLTTCAPNQNFNDYKTFSLVNRKHDLDTIENLNIKYVEATIRHDVSRELTKHGLKYQTSEADLLVDYILLVKENNIHSVDEEKEPIYNYELLWKRPRTFHGTVIGNGSKNNFTENNTTVRDDKIEEETLIILIKDKKDNTIVWKGQCTKRLVDGENFSDELPSAIRKIFRHFIVSK